MAKKTRSIDGPTDQPHASREADVSRRLGEYKRIVRQTNLIGAGLLAEVALFNGLHSDAVYTEICTAVFTVLFLLAGAFTAWARSGPEWQIDVIESLVERRIIDKQMTMNQAKAASPGVDVDVPRWHYQVAIMLTIFAGFVLLVLAALPLYHPASNAFALPHGIGHPPMLRPTPATSH